MYKADVVQRAHACLASEEHKNKCMAIDCLLADAQMVMQVFDEMK